jgi:vacuolar protein sorting-associated protein 3
MKNLSSEMEGVDTLLMYLYRALDLVDDMEKLASSKNSCVVVCI